LSDLVSHFRRQIDSAKAPTDAIYPRLALSAFHWWNDDKDEAIAEFGKVVEQSKSESELRLDLAELMEQQGERSDALALADAVQPLDNSTMKRREELALRLAVLTGDLERARQAAERLFGLRLDTETQVTLAGQISRFSPPNLRLERKRRLGVSRRTHLSWPCSASKGNLRWRGATGPARRAPGARCSSSWSSPPIGP
jgi:Tetratricopeptide repeat